MINSNHSKFYLQRSTWIDSNVNPFINCLLSIVHHDKSDWIYLRPWYHSTWWDIGSANLPYDKGVTAEYSSAPDFSILASHLYCILHSPKYFNSNQSWTLHVCIPYSSKTDLFSMEMWRIFCLWCVHELFLFSSSTYSEPYALSAAHSRSEIIIWERVVTWVPATLTWRIEGRNSECPSGEVTEVMGSVS